MIESIFVTVLFVLFTLQWEVKRRIQKKSTGVDPDVFARASSPLQRYIAKLGIVMTIYIIILIVLHSLNFQYGCLFIRHGSLESKAWDIAGFVMGLAGLGLCLYAQCLMGNSWRVGIDEERETVLITDGIYRYIRNPTYLGLFVLVTGIWIIWPTWTMALFAMAFILFLEIQVRCEEEFLIRRHGEDYAGYIGMTRRYFPWIY